jgi:hypothetical protein
VSAIRARAGASTRHSSGRPGARCATMPEARPIG